MPPSRLEAEIRKNFRYNLFVNLLDGGFFGLGWGFGSIGTILPLFVSRVTDSALLIGLITALHGVAWQFPQLFLANRISRLRRYKPMVMWLTIHERVPYLGFAMVAFVLPALGSTTALILIFLLLLWQGIGSGLTANPWQSMIAKIIPSDWRGTFFGLQAGLANVCISMTAIAAGYILERLPDRMDFTLTFILAAVGMGLSMIFLGRTREPVDTEKTIPPRQPLPWHEWLDILRRDRNFSAYLMVRFLSSFATMGFAFYIVYGLRRFGMDEVTAGFLTAALTITSTVANAVMGWLGDRIGHRAMLIAGSIAVTASSLLAWGAPSITWMYPVFILSGLANVAYWTIGMAITAEFGTEETRPTYIGLSNTLVAPATILAPLIGGWIVDAAGFQTTFMVSAVGGLVIAALLLWLVRDPVAEPAFINTGGRMTLVQEKVQQAVQILAETNVDAWLTFVRETSGVRDPVMDFIFGPADLTWESILLIARTGERLAIVGRFEADAVTRLDVYGTVTGYDESLRPHLVAALEKLHPRTIAINTSRNNVHADGLTHGLYEILRDYLSGTPYVDRLVSSEEIINALRGRKTPAEAERIRRAVATTAMIYANIFEYMQAGMTEENVGEYMHEQVKRLGLETAWSYGGCPMVNAGPGSQVGHGGPTSLKIEAGQIIHFDFGVKQDDYCSDIQRVVYVLRPGETKPPAEVQRGFDVIRRAIEAARSALTPGAAGKDVDAAARSVVTGAGFPEYKYATGHQLGRVAHDGGALLGPLWERYGDSPNQKVEAGQVYTLEPGLEVPGYGYIGLEEDVIVTGTGADYLGEPQTEIITMKA